MTLLEINKNYHSELSLSIQSGKIIPFYNIYETQLKSIILFLKLVNSDLIWIMLLFNYYLMYLSLCWVINLYDKHSFLIRMVLLLKYRWRCNTYINPF